MDMKPVLGPIDGMKAEANASVITKEELMRILDQIDKEKKG